MDAWSNPRIRQKPINEELGDFVSELETLMAGKVDPKEFDAMKAMLDDGKPKEEKKSSLNEKLIEKKIEEEKE